VTGLIESLERGSKMKISEGLSSKCNSIAFDIFAASPRKNIGVYSL
jgi:hypothetical protein